jgi:hypothetical protein
MEAAEDAKGGQLAADVEAAPPAPEAPAAVSFREVLRTADAADVALMVAGSICGAACGSVQPWCVRAARRDARASKALPRKRHSPTVAAAAARARHAAL